MSEPLSIGEMQEWIRAIAGADCHSQAEPVPVRAPKGRDGAWAEDKGICKMDPQLVWENLVDMMAECRTTPPSTHEEEQDVVRESILERLDTLTGWIKSGGWIPNPKAGIGYDLALKRLERLMEKKRAALEGGMTWPDAFCYVGCTTAVIFGILGIVWMCR